MPSPAIAGNRVPLNLGAKFTGGTNRLPLNLGVEGAGGPAPPVVVGNLTAGTRARWSRSTPTLFKDLRGRWAPAVDTARAWRVGWGGAQSQARHAALTWGTPPTHYQAMSLRWAGAADSIAAASRMRWDSNPVIGRGTQVRWGTGQAELQASLRGPWLSPPSVAGVRHVRWRGAGDVLQRVSLARWLQPPRLFQHWVIPWGWGRGLDWIVRPTPPPVEPPGETPSDSRRIGLDLACPAFAGDTRRVPLNLGVSACWLARPQRRTYIVLNQIEVVRLPDRLPIHADAVSLAGGRDAWAWDARLTLADPSQLAALQPTASGPRSVEISLNGYKWVIAVEDYDRARVFVGKEISVSGRSVSALLAEPYAPPRTQETAQARTMVQLAEAELAGSGITLDYGTVSWLVDAGAWYYDGLSPMSALMRIAEASGGVVQSHPSLPTVQIRARYPVSPWLWTTTTPDVVIQDDIVIGDRLQLQSKPVFDAVICAGERVGVSARVRRDGELGQTYAPQQVDQLITHADGARERGRNVLSDRGGQASVDHDLPLFAAPLQIGQPGLVLPMMLARRESPDETWHGLVTAVRIEARRSDKAVEIVQTVTIERHYTDAD